MATALRAARPDQGTLRALGVDGAEPSESTFRRVLQRLDADAFDRLAGVCAAQRTAPGPGARRVIAVDGKTLRGSGHGEQDTRHLLAAFDHAYGVVLGQVDVDTKTNECVWPGGHPGEMKWSGGPPGAVAVEILER